MNTREALAEEIYAAADALEIPHELIAPLIAKGVTTEIGHDLYEIFEKHGADRWILGTLGSWYDYWNDDAETLKSLRSWNKDWREYYGTSGAAASDPRKP